MYGDTVVLLLLNWLSYVYAVKTIDVRSYTCDEQTFLDNEGRLYLEWLGSNLPDPCQYKITKNDYVDETCVYPDVWDVSNTDAEIEYHKHIYTTSLADEKFNSHTRPYGDWCTTAKNLIISFQSTGGYDHVKLKVFIKKYEDPIDHSFESSSSSYGIIVAAVVIPAVIGLLMIICVVVIRVRRGQAGNMASRTRYAYHTTSSGGVTIQTGPNSQTPYQPQAVAPGQAGYTYHPPQAAYPVGTNQPTGYPPQQSGYPSQQSGYVPPPGGYYGQGTNQATSYPTGNIPPPVQGEHRPSPQPSPGAMHESIPSAPPDPSASHASRYDPPPYPGY